MAFDGTAPQPAVRPGRRARRSPRRCCVFYTASTRRRRRAGALAERRRRRRDAVARVQGRAARRRDREPGRARTASRAARRRPATGARRLPSHAGTAAPPARRPEPEGRWRCRSPPTDDRGRQLDRRPGVFSLNRTLGSLRVAPARVVVRRAGGSLARRRSRSRAPARVHRARSRRASGAVVRHESATPLAAGARTLELERPRGSGAVRAGHVRRARDAVERRRRSRPRRSAVPRPARALGERSRPASLVRGHRRGHHRSSATTASTPSSC